MRRHKRKSAQPVHGRLIENSEELQEFWRHVRATRRVAFDTEFHSEHSYKPKLYLLQLATLHAETGEQELVAVDPLEIPDLDVQLRVLEEEGIETVVHAGEVDLHILESQFNIIPFGVFDTQVAAGFIDLGFPMGLRNLVQCVLHFNLKKSETLSDWSRRPLREEQLSYAYLDVAYLLELQDILIERITKCDRLEWMNEEMERRCTGKNLVRNPDTVYLRIGGWRRLKGNDRAILMRIAAFREHKAAEVDRPTKHIMDDRLMLDIARAKPKSTSDLFQNRRIHKKFVQRYGEGVLKAVAEGKDMPKDQWPDEPLPPLTAKQQGLVELMTTAVRVQCRETGISVDLVAPKKTLHKLARADVNDEASIATLWGGWRAELLATILTGFIQGRVALGLNPDDHSARLVDIT
jgi:ribonuclease D